MTELRIENPDDDHLEVYVGDELVASANHDEHGWSGMDAVEKTARAVERALRSEVERLRDEMPECNGLCLRASDLIEVSDDRVARPHRGCRLHGDPDVVAGELEAEVERLRAELNAIGDLAYRADPADGEDALLVIQTRAKRAAGGA